MAKLIEAEVAKDYLKRAIFGADTKIDSWVDAMPGADAELVRHGHWILYDDLPPWFECSKCGFTGMATMYCADCGAKMDGDDDG